MTRQTDNSKLGEYYRCRTVDIDAGGVELTARVRGALGGGEDTRPASRLLATHASVGPGGRVLVLHCREGLAGMGVAVGDPSARVTMIDSHLAAVFSARQTARANGVGNVEVIIGDCARPVFGQTFDAVLALLPKSRPTWEQTILDASAVLRPGGSFFLAGAKNCGIKSAAKFAGDVFGEVEVVAYKGGSRLLKAVRAPGPAPPPGEYYSWHKVTAPLAGGRIEFVTRAGLFSRDRLDDGSRMLMESMAADQRPRPTDRVLDLGCGSGVLTLAAARAVPGGSVVAVDADCRAVEATGRNIEASGLTNAEARLSDCIEAVAGERFDVVITNPPRHQARKGDFDLTDQFIFGSAGVLRPAGRLLLVASHFSRYRRVMEQVFRTVEVVCEDNRFSVFCAQRPRR
jgi:16S rRNA (guanine1207-N2)-methyltransferase